ncbi:hypothetical protein CJU90_6035 [Yarrowia sp. C11]|nr:hypothetical protein CJU90_6035 [Yarrowia sp. C11]KAG5370750.1 hypothetical protein CKK34_0875 [Yarrowia sp. E02]
MSFVMPDYAETDQAHSPPATPLPQSQDDPFAPPVDIYDLGNMYIVVTSLPAVRSTDLETAYDAASNSLTLSGTFTNPFAHLSDCLMITERHNGTFQRTVRFPSNVKIDSEKVKMHMANGILEMHLMKQQDGPK